MAVEVAASNIYMTYVHVCIVHLRDCDKYDENLQFQSPKRSVKLHDGSYGWAEVITIKVGDQQCMNVLLHCVYKLICTTSLPYPTLINFYCTLVL